MWAAVGLSILLWAAIFAASVQGTYDTAVGVTLFHVIGAVGAAGTWFVARRTETQAVVRIIVAGWVAKMLGTLASFYVLQVVYGGAGDATRYTRVGAVVADTLRAGRLESPSPGTRFVGTTFLEFVTGVVFAFTGQTTLGGFAVFSALGFVGLLLIYRGVRIAAPEVDRQRFARLLFFLPSMVFWPSAIGKEALMLLAIGLFIYGAARLFVGSGTGLIALAAGCALSAMVRPHITLMLVAALVLATVLVRSSAASRHNPLGKMLRIALAGTLLVWAAVAAGSFLELDQLDSGSVGAALKSTSDQTYTGGSAFSNASPANLPLAVITVLYRPLPFEVGNLQAAIASFEGMLLLALTIRWRQSVLAAIKGARSSPLLAIALAYIVVFVSAYTGFNNFGLLARQRVQVYPFLILILCVVGQPPRASAADDGKTLAKANHSRFGSPTATPPSPVKGQ